MYFRRKRRGYKALHTIPLLFAHRFAKAEAMIIIANYYTCSSQAGHWCWIRVRASKRYVWAQHRLNRGVPVAAAGRDRGLLHLHADCVYSCSPAWTKCPAVFRSSRAIPDICVTGPPRPLFAATSLIPAAVTPQQIFKQTRYIPNKDTHTHTLCISTTPLILGFQGDEAAQLPYKAMPPHRTWARCHAAGTFTAAHQWIYKGFGGLCCYMPAAGGLTATNPLHGEHIPSPVQSQGTDCPSTFFAIRLK